MQEKATAHLIVFLALVLIAGCARSPQVTSRPPTQVTLQPQRTSAIIQVPKDTVWPLLVSEVALNFPIKAIEKENGLLTTQFLQIPVGIKNSKMENYVFPPKVFLYKWNGLRIKMRILVTDHEPGKTKVNINAHYEAYENNVSKSWLAVRSNGSVENQILLNIEQKLK
jgi:hypothetical protein